MAGVTQGEITLEAARAAKGKVAELLKDDPLLCGLGITRVNGRYGVKVNLKSEPQKGVRLPYEVDGVPIVVEVVGVIVKQRP